MPPFNGRQLHQQLRAFLVFIQLHIMMYLLFVCRPQQPPPSPIQRPRRRHNMWVRPWLLQREERGAYHNIMAEMYATDIPGFTNYMRMTSEYKSCCSNQSFSGPPNIPKTINQLCMFQISRPFPNISHPPNKQTNPMPYRSHPTDKQTKPMPNKQTNPMPQKSPN